MSEKPDTPDRSAPPDNWPVEGCSGKGTDYAFSVEARYEYHEPFAVGDIKLDLRWRRIHFPKGYPGVPVRRSWDYAKQATDLMSYEAAQALRWWFIADLAASDHGAYCIQTRIVKHEIVYSYAAKAVSAQDAMAWGGRPLVQTKEAPK